MARVRCCLSQHSGTGANQRDIVRVSLAGVPLRLAPGEWTRIKVELGGVKVSLYVNGAPQSAHSPNVKTERVCGFSFQVIDSKYVIFENRKFLRFSIFSCLAKREGKRRISVGCTHPRTRDAEALDRPVQSSVVPEGE